MSSTCHGPHWLVEFFAKIQIFTPMARCNPQNSLLPDFYTAPDAQNAPQDLWSHLYIDLTLKLEAPDAWISVIGSATVEQDSLFLFCGVCLFQTPFLETAWREQGRILKFKTEFMRPVVWFCPFGGGGSFRNLMCLAICRICMAFISFNSFTLVSLFRIINLSE